MGNVPYTFTYRLNEENDDVERVKAEPWVYWLGWQCGGAAVRHGRRGRERERESEGDGEANGRSTTLRDGS
jgi:hypothetical protein